MAVDPFVVHVARLRRAPRHPLARGASGSVRPRRQIAPRTERRQRPCPPARRPPATSCSSPSPVASWSPGRSRPPGGALPALHRRVGGELAIRVRERFVPPTPAGRAAEDEEAYPIDRRRARPRPDGPRAVILELPLAAPVCRRGAGACAPTAGRTATRSPATAWPRRDPRWANLDVLRSSPLGS